MGNVDPAALSAGGRGKKKKQKERSRRRESQRDQVWHSACHLAHFPLGSYFALPVEDSWRVHLQKQLSLIFPKSCFFFFFLIVRSRDYQSNRYFNKLVYFSLFFFANRVFHSVCSQRNINPAENSSYLQPLHFINHPSEHINVIYDRRIIYR